MDTIIPVLLFCPICKGQHIDRDEWATKPHRKHLCEHCGNIWRASNLNTVGVESVEIVAPRVTKEDFEDLENAKKELNDLMGEVKDIL